MTFLKNKEHCILKRKSKSGCLWLIAAAAVFIILIYGVLIACMTLQDDSAAKENSLKQVASCERAASESPDKIRGYFDKESCRELIKQHAARFKSPE